MPGLCGYRARSGLRVDPCFTPFDLLRRLVISRTFIFSIIHDGPSFSQTQAFSDDRVDHRSSFWPPRSLIKHVSECFGIGVCEV